MSQHPELLRGARLSTTLLTGDQEANYVGRLERIVRAARLNLYYPDARGIRAHIEAMHPRIHKGLYEGIEMNLQSGLPSYKEWTRVQTDVALAPDQLRQLGNRAALAAKAKPGTPHEKQLHKFDYYKALAGRPLANLGDMQVKLKRIDAEANKAWFHVILDKLDASGLFVRYVIELSQTSSGFSKQIVTLDDETAGHTEAFQSLIYQFTSLDAEFTYAKLHAIEGIEIERVVKGTIGPFYFSAEQAPPVLRPLFEAPGAFVAMFAQDMVAQDVVDERNNDPLGQFFLDSLSAEARQGYERARAQFEYKCFKDRKFVVPRTLKAATHELCVARGTKNIIYTV